LTIPTTSVSSESTFSTGGRVLDDYRSSLKLAMVEALVCASSWTKGAHNDNKKSMNVVCSLLLLIYFSIVFPMHISLDCFYSFRRKIMTMMLRPFHFQRVWWAATSKF
jgi:hypothetical protein